MASDYEKHNEAIRYGWSLMYLMAHDLEKKTIKKTIEYVHHTIILRSSCIETVQKCSKGVAPRTLSPQDLFERMKNAKSYRRRK